MVTKDVILWPNSILSKKSEEVKDFNGIPDLADFMMQVMHANRGLGLSAVQVGELKRMFTMVVKVDEQEDREVVLVNPVITELSGAKVKFTEGCLSFPGVEVETERFTKAAVDYQDERGEKITETFEGLAAICVQHEMEHLDGKTFLRYVSWTKRQLITTSMKKRFK